MFCLTAACFHTGPPDLGAAVAAALCVMCLCCAVLRLFNHAWGCAVLALLPAPRLLLHTCLRRRPGTAVQQWQRASRRVVSIAVHALQGDHEWLLTIFDQAIRPQALMRLVRLLCLTDLVVLPLVQPSLPVPLQGHRGEHAGQDWHKAAGTRQTACRLCAHHHAQHQP